MNKMMSSLINTTQIVTATIKSIEKETYKVQTDHITLKAKKATGCMVDLFIGDKVLISQDKDEVYILFVLESKNPQNVAIVADNITLHAHNTINSFAKKATVVIPEVSFVSKLLSLKSHAVTLVCDAYSAMIDTFTMKNKEQHTIVEGHMETQMRSSRRVVDGSDIHQIEESITISKGQVKIDAEQVNIA